MLPKRWFQVRCYWLLQTTDRYMWDRTRRLHMPMCCRALRISPEKDVSAGCMQSPAPSRTCWMPRSNIMEKTLGWCRETKLVSNSGLASALLTWRGNVWETLLWCHLPLPALTNHSILARIHWSVVMGRSPMRKLMFPYWQLHAEKAILA